MYGIAAKLAAEQRIQTFPHYCKDWRAARSLILAINIDHRSRIYR